MTGPPQAVLYVLGEPTASVRSIFRRKRQRYLLRQLTDHTGCDVSVDTQTIQALGAHADRSPAFTNLSAYAAWLARGAQFDNVTSPPGGQQLAPDPLQAAMREHLCAWAALSQGKGSGGRVAGAAQLSQATDTGRPAVGGLPSTPAVAFASVALLAQQPHLVPQLLHSTCVQHGRTSCDSVLGMHLRVELRNRTAEAAPTTAAAPDVPTPDATAHHHSSTAAASTPSHAMGGEEWQVLRRSYASLGAAVQALDGCTRYGHGRWSAPACASALQTMCHGATA
jgi:hypothetical protein